MSTDFTEPPEWQTDAALAEQQDGDLDRLMAVEWRRSLITMLTALNRRYGFHEIVIPGERPR